MVDLITNSSSELFVCDTEKSLDMVKEVLVKLCGLYNEKQNLKLPEHRYALNMDKLFTDVFNEPYIQEGDRDIEGYGVFIPKNTIIIESASDNSIPYDLFDDIESIFHAQRHHLG